MTAKFLRKYLFAFLFGCVFLAAFTVADDVAPTAKELLAGLIAIPSTEESGKAKEAAEFLARKLIAAGFPAEDVTLLGPSETVGGLVARLSGRGTKRPVLLLAHLDVVPAVAESWSVDPFKLVARDGYLYGRGTLDNKTGAATLVSNLIRMKREGIVAERDLVVVLTLDEETEMQSIQWLLEHHAPLLEAEFALNTDSGGVSMIDGRAAVFSIQAAEKVYMTLELRADNPGGHSSVPQPENAIYTLARALNKIAAFQFPVSLNDISRENFASPSQLIDAPVRSAMQKLAAGKAEPHDIDLLQSVPSINAQMRTTCVATQLSGGHAENALPTFAIAVVNCRILPQEDAIDVETRLSALIADDAIRMRRTYEPVPSPPSTLVPEVFDRITRIATDMFPGIEIVPVMQTGATDSLYTRNVGIPTYGVDAVATSPEDNRSHGIDERISEVAFIDNVEFWFRLMSAL